MKTLLICTDFSESADHAARYGCMLARQYKFGAITLFHAYQMFVPPTDMAFDSSVSYAGNEPFMEQLKSLKEELVKLTGKDITIRTRAENLTLGESINNICREEKADMVIMGISGSSKIEKTFIGSNTITVSQNSKYPVLVVPVQAPVEPVHSILLACDLSKVTAATPLGLLNDIMELFKAPLYVLNVDDKNFSPQTPEELYQLHHIYDKYKPHYAFIDTTDIIKGITDYTEKNNISLIITIPKNYNFIERLFHRSTTLIWQSPVPILTLHE